MLVETLEHKGFTIEIHADDSPESPREWDNFGTMVCNHRRYNLGDIKGDMEDVPEGAITLPLYLYDHSGLSMSTGTAYPYCLPVGAIYVTREDALREFSAKRITKEVREKAEQLLRNEVETYDQFLRGDVYGYVVKDDEGNDMDSCWGFFGLEFAIEQAKGAASHVAESSLAYAI